MAEHSETKRVAPGDSFLLSRGQQVLLDGTNLVFELVDVKRKYAGHRFEELGDKFSATLKLILGERQETLRFSWWEREAPPGRVLTCHGYDIEVFRCSTGHYYKDRWLVLQVTRCPDQLSDPKDNAKA